MWGLIKLQFEFNTQTLDEGSKLLNGTCCPLSPEVIKLDLEDISGLAPRFPKQLLQRLRPFSSFACEHGVDVHRYGGVEVGQLEGGTRDQEGGVYLVCPPG